MTSEPSQFVQPDVTEARVERLWSNVAQRLEPRVRIWRWLLLGSALCSAAGAGYFAVKTVPERGIVASAVLADAKLETKSDELAVTFNDGSRVKLGARSTVQVRGNQATSVSLALARGQVECDVTHREGRTFTVVAGDVEVRVVGTMFSVNASSGESPRVEVSVRRGVVEVTSRRRPGIVARVAAGQSWTQEQEGASRTLEREPKSEPLVAQPEPKRDAAPAPSTQAAKPTARELFEKASESRRAGDAAAAAQAYGELLRLHPNDPRTGLAAFELGRLRMDRLGDRAGAIVALERAVALNIGPSFREDALARLVSVYAAQGNSAACSRARDRYLASYPAGVHAAAVGSRCGSR